MLNSTFVASKKRHNDKKMDNLRSIITAKILNNIPPYTKSIDYLMQTLGISRESVYRRIRGDISFTLEEIAKLSIELGFSIDELIMKDIPSRVFLNVHTTHTQNSSDIYTTIFQRYLDDAYNIENTKDIESIMAINQVPHEFIVYFNHLFKFAYYRWMHQHQESSLKYFYSDVTLPENLISLQYKSIDCLKKIKSNTIIIDSNVFINLIQEIQYYYKCRLINDDEFNHLKNDLLDLVNMMENIAQTGFYGSNAKFNFYLSSLNIDSGGRYLKFNNQTKSIFFVNSIEPVIVVNANLCAMHKKWLDSMRKYATLITQSNEILQVKYFNKQRNHIEEIVKGPIITSL